MERETDTMSVIDTYRDYRRARRAGKYVCNECGFNSNSEVSFQEHCLNPDLCNNFQCCYCGDKFYYKYDMIKHEFIHIIEINEVHPKTCDKCLSDHTSWKVYLKCRRECTRKKSLTCRKCSVSFVNNEEKEIHQKTCSKLKTNCKTSFLCEMCGKMVTTYQSFNNHYRTHTGEKPYACKVCGRSFATYTGLYSHKRIHTNEKPYQCNECGKTSSQRSALLMHLKTHTGEKSFKCTVCGKLYVTKAVLKVHKKTHTELRECFATC